jgi:hypothetical protein
MLRVRCDSISRAHWSQICCKITARDSVEAKILDYSSTCKRHVRNVNNITIVSACPNTFECEDSSLVQNTSYRPTPSTNSDTRLLANR